MAWILHPPSMLLKISVLIATDVNRELNWVIL